MANILVENNFYIGTSSACIIDTTPPTFAGINFLDVESRGQIRAGWSAGTDATAPIRYEVYIQVSTATGLFNTANIVNITDKLQTDIFTLPDGSFLINGSTYYVGVRAVDAVGNRNTNTVSMSVISTGVLTAIDVYRNEAVFSVDHSNNFRGTLWSNKNDSLAISPYAVLGTASYQVYDKTGAAIVGMSQSGITANAQGMYIITPVANQLAEDLDHYLVKVTISVDGENRVNHVAIDDKKVKYEVFGTSSTDAGNNLIGSFWVAVDEVLQSTDLGLGSYETFLPDGTPILGLSESGISPDANGFFAITPFALPPEIDTTLNYIVKLTVEVDGLTVSKNIIIEASPTQYTVKSVFSINGANQFESTFWTTRNDELSDPSILGTASYQIYDKSGVAVAGLSQSGISADSNGYFHITPVSATLLTDLTHYVAKITIQVAGADRTVSKGFTLLGT